MTRQIKTETAIDAPASLVWQVLIDGSRYPDWNPFILEVRGELREAASIAYRFEFLERVRFWATARILKVEPDTELRWTAHFVSPVVFKGEHYFSIEPTTGSRTVFHHGEVFSGLLVPIVWPLLRRRGPRVYARLGSALKVRVEQRH